MSEFDDSEVDVIERGDSLVVVDGSGRSHELDLDNGHVSQCQSVDEDVIRWIQENTDYYATQSVSFPVRFTSGRHLKKEITREFCREVQVQFNDVFPHMTRLRLPSTETTENWVVRDDGRAEIESFEYDGVTYTPEE